GDTVEIITAKNHVPSKDWLKFVRTSKAKQRIRAFLKSEERARSLAIGLDLLSKDLRKVKLSIKKLEQEGKILEAAKHFGLKAEGDLYAEIGYGKITSAKVLSQLLPEEAGIENKIEAPTSPLARIFQRAAKASRDKVGVKVSGFDDILVRFSKCCEPLPGDRIIGFITRGRGVSVHHADCPQVLHSDPARRVEIHWDTDVKAQRKVRITVHSQDQIGLLANVTRAITEHGANINSAQIKTTEFGKAINTFELTINDAQQLEQIKRGIEMVPGVIKVERITSFSSATQGVSAARGRSHG
ncbi:MAG: GTP pyrophosphokinase, partial [Proteobacteria bacterium]